MQAPQPGPLRLSTLQDIWRTIKRQTLQAGPGVRLTSTADGTIISAVIPAQPYRHPWQTASSGRDVTVRPGFVDGEPAMIRDVPLAGTATEPAPTLLLPKNFPVSGMAVVVRRTAPAAPTEPPIITVSLFPLPYKIETTEDYATWPVSFLLPTPTGQPIVIAHAYRNLGVRVTTTEPLRAYWFAQP